MNRKKEITKAYKERRASGGVYTITNTQNGKYLLGHAADLNSVRNRFQFAQTTGLVVHPKMKQDWEQQGPQAFKLEILEELEPQPGQNASEFLADLKMLEELWQDKLELQKAY
ncbi:hypothetical protein KDA_44160 [Dictyobacter alpinus]|uniref:LuxR family transcriptional regulator n=1 Tax=Dictyobacter alpinus TaxID=2014873 RepID=A0A402BCB9_9CHLR|nr:GIY-YIG nuclease family protein [Dictyobacter alpinus]GCE28932.1 hypothetical protein KDA_44160 [Dictyobacter alpinus]